MSDNENEKLIEEARRAKRAVYLATDASVADDLSRIIGGLADALEAAEKAHTPTDDERALIEQAQSFREQVGDDANPTSLVGLWLRTASALEYRIRRSVVPEPSAEDQGPAASCHLCVGAGGHEDHDGEWVECSCQRREPQGEPSDATECEYIDVEIGATCQNFYDTPCETGDCGESYCWTCNACDACKASAVTEQGEN
jgi:hypothetical protein